MLILLVYLLRVKVTKLTRTNRTSAKSSVPSETDTQAEILESSASDTVNNVMFSLAKVAPSHPLVGAVDSEPFAEIHHSNHSKKIIKTQSMVPTENHCSKSR
jgi:hypothetical protein